MKRRGTRLAQMDFVPFDRPLPIAIAIHNFQPGGTERQMTELVRRLDPRRWQVHLACLRCDGAWFDRAAEVAASVAEFPVTSFSNAGTFAQMRAFAKWCRDQRIALVHSSELYSNIFFLPAAAMAAVPVRVGSRREIAAGKSVAQIAAQRGAYTFAHRVVANAEAVASRLRREGSGLIAHLGRAQRSRPLAVHATAPALETATHRHGGESSPRQGPRHVDRGGTIDSGTVP